MILSRSIGSVLRGKATRPQVFLAALLAGMLGFVPGFFLPGDLAGGFGQCPGLILSLIFLVMILNANLGVFGLTLVIAKLLSFVLLPVSFAVGRFLLDGPTQDLFQALINGKVTAWFGLEYYATSGGLVLGTVFGALCGVLLIKFLGKVRTRMVKVEESSELYQKWSKKRSVRVLSWAFLGKGKGKKTWREVAEQKGGLPVRILGVALVAVVAACIWFGADSWSAPVLTSSTREALEKVNGATVDLGQAQLEVSSGTLKFTGLAIADGEALDRDLFRADELVARIDTGELLRKRLVIDELRSTGAKSGAQRATPGVKLPEPPQPPAPPPVVDAKAIEDYLKTAEQWKQRLEQAREWIEWFAGGDEVAVEGQPEEVKQRIEQSIEAQREAMGTARVAATHLIEGVPAVWIRKLDLEGIDRADLPGETLDLRGRNLSSSPSMVKDPAAISLQSRSGKVLFELNGGGAAGGVGFAVGYQGLPVDAFFGQVKLSGPPPLQGGTIDVAAKGTFTSVPGQAMTVDMPLQATLRQTTFAFPGVQPTKVESLLLPVGVRGALASPSVTLDDKALSDALVKAGQQELANFVNAQAGKLLGGKLPGVGDLVDPTKSVGENLDAAKAKAEEEARKAAEAAKKKAEDEAKQKALDALKKRGVKLPGGGG